MDKDSKDNIFSGVQNKNVLGAIGFSRKLTDAVRAMSRSVSSYRRCAHVDLAAANPSPDCTKMHENVA